MKKITYLLIVASFALTACQGDKSRNLKLEIAELEKQDTSPLELKGKYLAFYQSSPEDSANSSYTLELARIYQSETPHTDSAALFAKVCFEEFPKGFSAPEAMLMFATLQKDIEERAHWYTQTHERYPNSRSGGNALIAMGVDYENEGRKDEALEAYQSYLATYPNGALVKDAEMSIKNINIPLEDLIKEFERKN